MHDTNTLYEIYKYMSIKKALIILLFLLYIFPLYSLPQSDKGSAVAAAREPVSRSELMLGTVCRITIYDNPQEAAFTEAFARIDAIEEQMSITRPESIVSKVNNEAGRNAVPVPVETFNVVQEAVHIARLSGGAFDPSIGPLVKAWGIGTDNARVPAQNEISSLLNLVDYRKVVLDTEKISIYLESPGMILDLGGIAKGYAADEVRKVLREQKVQSAIINLGGNVLTVGKKPDGSLWRIGIQDPAKDRGAYIMVLSIEDTAIVTSGPYERYFSIDDSLYHHILDTGTGYPVESDLGSVSIISGDSLIADALSTAFFAMGIEKGMALTESFESVEAAAVTWDNKIIVSSGFVNGTIQYELKDSDFTIIPTAKYLQTP